MLILVLCSAAALIARTIPLELMPALGSRSLTVDVQWPDASPESVETHVVSAVEQAAATLRGVAHVSSQSQRGRGTVTVELDPTAGVEAIRFELKDRMRRLELADEVRLTVRSGGSGFGSWSDPVTRLLYGLPSSSELPFRLRLSSPDPAWLDRHAGGEIRNAFLSAPGVADVTVSAGRTESIVITLEPRVVVPLTLGPPAVVGLLTERARSQTMVGTSQEAGVEIPVVSAARAVDLDELLNAGVPTLNGRLVPLGQVAAVELRSEPSGDRGRVNGAPAVLLDVAKKESANLVRFSRQMRSIASGLSAAYGPRLAVEVLADEGRQVEEVLVDLGTRLLISVGAVLLALLLFFKRVRPTLLVLATLTMTLLLTVAVMALAGVALSMVTVAAIVLAAGMLVDNSLVVYEHLHGSADREQIASRAAQVLPVIGAASLTNAVVFAPFLFLDGSLQALLVPFAVTMVAAMAASVVVTLLVVPLLYLALLRPDTRSTARSSLPSARPGSRVSVLPVLRSRRWLLPVVLGGTVYVLAVLLPEVWNAGTIARPTAADSVSVAIGMLSDARIAETDDVAGDFEALAIATVRRFEAGAELQVVTDVHRTRAAVRLSPPADLPVRSLSQRARSALYQVERQWTAQMGNYVSVGLSLHGPSGSVYGGGTGERFGRSSGSTVEFSGYDYRTLKQHVIAFSTHMRRIPYLYGVDNGFERNERVLFGPFFPGFDLVIDHEQMHAHSVTVSGIARAIAPYVLGESSVALVIEGHGRVPVRIAVDPDTRFFRMEEILDLRLNGHVRLGDVAELRPLNSALTIRREDQRYAHTVSYKVRPNQYMGARAALSTLLDTYPFPPGFTATLPDHQSVLAEQRQRSSLGLAALAGAVLVFMVLAGHFESFSRPALVLLSAPLALVAVVAGFAVAQQGFGLGALLGLVLLAGITVNDAILFAAETRRLEGGRRAASAPPKPIRLRATAGRRAGLIAGAAYALEALIRAPVGRPERIAAIAVRRRLRPILVTTVTTVAALLPSLFVPVAANQLLAVWREFAVVVIAGISASTAATVLVLPAVYVGAARIGGHGSGGGRPRPVGGDSLGGGENQLGS